MWSRLVAVAIGGAVGAVCRDLLTTWVKGWTSGSTFPWGTLAVNGLGSFALGLLMGLLTGERLGLTESHRLVLGIGFFGAFTTFSTFSHETLEALRLGHLRVALANVGVSVALGLLACWLGYTWGARG